MKFHKLNKNEELLWKAIPSRGKELTLRRIRRIALNIGIKEVAINKVINALCWKNFLVIQRYYKYKKGMGRKQSWNRLGDDGRYRRRFEKGRGKFNTFVTNV